MSLDKFQKPYNPAGVEGKIYETWMKSGYFTPENLPDAKKRKSYTIIMPPSNANAAPHIGHALGFTVQDILTRFHRMRGYRALYLPGTDHAGFETQVVFEKKLEKEGKSRFKMTREEFYKASWDFVQSNKHVTEESIRRMGVSCDWSRNIFTLDERIIKTVYETFEQMYQDGLVYRAGRICNWCPKHQTGLADLETKYEERTDPFYYFKYGPFIIGTARPETKFGDKYVVMHPDDTRYSKYKHGDKLELEWINDPITATVIKDKAVDMEFGSGVMTITPAHDPIDFEIAQRHNLDIEQVIDKLGKLLDVAGEFAGQKILEARPKIVEKIRNKGLLDKIDEKYKHNVQTCYKCGNLIEPQIIPQWYIATNKGFGKSKSSLRDLALDAVKNKKVEIVTKRFENTFFRWMENLRDWPISRQIWWGIPIPVWYCGGIEETPQKIMGFAGDIVPEVLKGKARTYRLRDHGLTVGQKLAFKNSASKTLFGHGVISSIQKTRVGKIKLPDQTHSGKYKNTSELIKAFKKQHPEKNVTEKTDAWIYDFEFHPLKKDCGQIVIAKDKPLKCPACRGTNLVQDPDTFDTWFSSGQWPYATLMAFGDKDYKSYFPTQVMETAWDIIFFWVARMIMLSFYKTGQAPFEKVLLHGLVRDKDRKKMSKSKGNVVDPLGVIDTYGTDALRMALIFSTAAGNDIPLAEDKIAGMKKFANKLWNIARFILSNVEKSDYKWDAITEADKEILKKLDETVEQSTKNIESFNLHEAAQQIYHFTWHELADKYIETSKKQMEDEGLKENTLAILLNCLIAILKLLHPFMPFITEEIWTSLREQKLVQNNNLLIVQHWPK